MEEKLFEINEQDKGVRIDKFITSIMEGKSRSYIQGMIDDGYVLVNDKEVKSNYKLKTGDKLKTLIKEPTELEVVKEDIPLDVLYEDSDIIVINKPKGMVVHPAPGNYTGTLVNALLYHCTDLSSINGVVRPGIVHRIDKDTTGVLVVAKNDEAHIKLSEQLKNHSMKREYYAIVEGRLKKDEGTIDKPLKRSKRDRLKIAIDPEGRHAVTHFEVIERFKNTSLVKCVLETGRTHQIRVHMASIGYPLVGDPLYGFKKSKFNDKGQLLHAKVLGFIHPKSGEYMEFSAELPENYKTLIENLRKDCI